MKILLVTEYSPFEATFGAQQRSRHLWRALCSIADVDVALIRQAEKVSAAKAEDPRFAVDATYRLLPLGLRKYAPDGNLSRAIARHVDLSRYDLICARYLGPVSKLKLPAGVPVIVDLDDVAYTYAAKAAWPSSLTSSLKALVKGALEKRAMRRYDRHFFVSRRDRDRFPELQGNVLPNIPVPPQAEPDPRATGKTILFVGALWYGPNREGVERFLARCWPAIVRAEPEAHLLLAGAAPPAVRANWAQQPNVRAPGFVPDLAAAYAGSAFSVVPVVSGGGTNIKVLESLSHARACVTTRFCFEGFRPNFVNGEDLLVADDDVQMIQHCVRLLRDAKARCAMGACGRASVAAHYSFESFQAVVVEQVQQIAPSMRSM